MAVEFHEQPNHMIACKKNERKTEETASFLFERERIKLQRSFSAMIKVVGPVCNLDCDYCYYLEKDALYSGTPFTVAAFGMREEMLEKVIRDYILSQPQEHIEFIWHGGEPTLLGLDYFRKILSLQKKNGQHSWQPTIFCADFRLTVRSICITVIVVIPMVKDLGLRW